MSDCVCTPLTQHVFVCNPVCSELFFFSTNNIPGSSSHLCRQRVFLYSNRFSFTTFPGYVDSFPLSLSLSLETVEDDDDVLSLLPRRRCHPSTSASFGVAVFGLCCCRRAQGQETSGKHTNGHKWTAAAQSLG